MVACFGKQPQAAAWHQLGGGGGARGVRGCKLVPDIPAVPVLRRSGENYGTMRWGLLLWQLANKDLPTRAGSRHGGVRVLGQEAAAAQAR